ncbi:MAG: sulfite exporter TauE/SafE family protein [Planctomycetota bacterium]
MEYLWLLLLGLVVGTFGTLIGAGGGFILMPILLLAYPAREPAVLTAISLAVVFFNASSGSCAYAKMRRVDFKSGLLFLTTGVPGAIAGAFVVNYIPRHTFNLVFGLVMLAAGLFIFFRSPCPDGHEARTRATFKRTVVEADGTRHDYAYSLPVGMAMSFGVGVASSLLGIGGGIIHVPAMVHLLNFPVHIATATSHFILAVMALAGTLVHVIDGSLGWEGLPRTLVLGAGAVMGAQIGAQLSKRVHGRWIMRSLAAALELVALRLVILALYQR